MLLALDVGNSSITFGVFEENRLLFSSKLSTVRSKCRDEYAVMLSGILNMHGVRPAQLDGAILSSVVPPLTGVIAGAAGQIAGVSPLIVGPGIRTGLNLRIDNPAQLGADIVASAAAALSMYEPPILIADFGCATTLTVINARSELCGVIIAAGIRSALDSLSASAAELPYIALEAPKHIIGKNTADSMKSGAVYGNVCMFEGFIRRIGQELDASGTLRVLATGGLAHCIVPYCDESLGIRLNPTLTLEGLNLLYRKNAQTPKL